MEVTRKFKVEEMGELSEGTDGKKSGVREELNHFHLQLL